MSKTYGTPNMNGELSETLQNLPEGGGEKQFNVTVTQIENDIDEPNVDHVLYTIPLPDGMHKTYFVHLTNTYKTFDIIGIWLTSVPNNSDTYSEFITLASVGPIKEFFTVSASFNPEAPGYMTLVGKTTGMPLNAADSELTLIELSDLKGE